MIKRLQTENSIADGLSDLTDLLATKREQRNKCVVRVKTTTWADKRGLYIKKSLTFLRRQCEGSNILEEDASGVGVEDIFPRILNLDECKDGIYEVVTCNVSRDYKSGYVDDYDYRLVAANATLNGAPTKDK